MKPDRRRQKSMLTMYHIGPRPAVPKPKNRYWFDQKPGDSPPVWERPWLKTGVRSGVFLTTNPVGIAINHGVTGNVYAYKISRKIIKQSGGIHRYDRGTEIVIPETIWGSGVKSGDIKFLGKSMNQVDFEKTVNKSWSGSVMSWVSPGSFPGRPGWDDRPIVQKYPKGLINSRDPESVIKQLTDKEKKLALDAIIDNRKKIQSQVTSFYKSTRPGRKAIGRPTWRPRYEPIDNNREKEQMVIDLLKQYLSESLLRRTVKKMLLEAEVDEEVLDSFKPKGNLEPKFFTDKKLDTQIKNKLLKIAKDFKNMFDFPIAIEDITLTGSLANYNWSQYSDIDLHIIVDFDMVDENTELVKEAFGKASAVWNNQHDIFIEGYEVEIYVQNLREPHHSTGVYSLEDDRWVREPGNRDQESVPSEVKRQAKLLIKRIDHIEKLVEIEEYAEALEAIERLKRKVKRMRQSGLASQGEYSPENLAFKVLRRMGQLERVNSLKFGAYDKSISQD